MKRHLWTYDPKNLSWKNFLNFSLAIDLISIIYGLILLTSLIWSNSPSYFFLILIEAVVCISFGLYNYHTNTSNFIRSTNISYYITGHSIIFEWGILFKRRDIIELSDLVKIHKVIYENEEKVTFIFISKNKLRYHGYDSSNRRYRNHPSFEKIPLDQEVENILLNRLKNYFADPSQIIQLKNPQIKSEKSSLYINIARSYLLTAILFGIYFTDSNVLQSNMINDTIISRRNSPQKQIVYDKFQTKQGHIFSLTKSIFKAGDQVELGISPVYQMVTSVYAKNEDHSNKLISGCKGISQLSYVSTTLTLILGAIYIFQTANYINQDYIIIAIVIPVGLSIYSILCLLVLNFNLI